MAFGLCNLLQHIIKIRLARGQLIASLAGCEREHGERVVGEIDLSGFKNLTGLNKRYIILKAKFDKIILKTMLLQKGWEQSIFLAIRALLSPQPIQFTKAYY